MSRIYIRFELEHPEKVDKDVTIGKILKTLIELQKIDSIFENWYSTERPKKGKGYEKIELTKEYLSLRYDKSCMDKASKVIDYSFGIVDEIKNSSNYQKSFVITFSLDKTSKLVNNVIVFRFPDFIDSDHSFIINNECIEKIVAIFNRIWQPRDIVRGL